MFKNNFSLFILLIAIVLGGFFLRIFAAYDYWNWFDTVFPETWQHSRIVLSQDGTQYAQQAGPGTWCSTVFQKWRQLPYYRPPLASYYFTVLFRMFGFNRLAVSAIQAAAACSAYLLIYLITCRLFGRRTGLAALILIAVHPVLIFYDHSFEDSSIALLMLALTLYVFLRALPSKPGLLFVSGLFAGLSVLARPNLAIVVLCLAVYAGVSARRKRLKDLLMFCIPVLLVVSPAAWHNYRVSGQISFGTATTGENLFWGNCENPRWRIMLQGFWYIPYIDRGSPGNSLIGKLKKDFKAPTVETAFRRAAWTYIRKNPVRTFSGFLQKLLRHFSNYEIPRNRNFYLLRTKVPLYQLPLIPYSVLIGFVLAGIYALRGRPRIWLILLFPWVCVLVTESLFFNASRYRSAAIPFLVPLALAGAGAAAESIQRRRWKHILACLAVLLLLFIMGKVSVTESEKQQYLSAGLFNAAMMQAYGKGTDRRFALYDERRFLDNLQGSLGHDPDNLAAFDTFQKYLIWKGRGGMAAENIRKRRQRCAPDDWLCARICDNLANMTKQAL